MPAAASRASFVITFAQVGNDVTATGTGTINLSGLTIVNPTAVTTTSVFSSAATLTVGANGNSRTYSGFTSAAGAFGTGGSVTQSSGTDGPVGVTNLFGGWLIVPRDYVSGDPLTATSTFNNRTLAGLGLTPGTYDWNWGNGANTDFLRVFVPVPEPATVGLVAVGGLLGVRRFRRR